VQLAQGTSKSKRKWEHQRKNQGGFSTYNKEAIQTLKILIAESPTQMFFLAKPNYNNSGNLHAMVMVLS
jgi:hypothetical protein